MNTAVWCEHGTSANVVDAEKNGSIAKNLQSINFTPQLYNIWSFAKNNNDNDHFGNMQKLMEVRS